MTLVRSADPDDVAAIARLEEVTLGADAWPRTLVQDGVAGGLPTVRYLLAEVDGAVAAYAVASLTPDVAELQRLGVDPAYRRRGLATLLLDAVTGLAAAHGAERLLVEVREDNAAALGLYAAHGFGRIGRRRRYYRDGADALVLERSLAPAGTMSR